MILNARLKIVCAANLAETEFEALHAENNKLELELAPNKIKTIYFEIQSVKNGAVKRHRPFKDRCCCKVNLLKKVQI